MATEEAAGELLATDSVGFGSAIATLADTSTPTRIIRANMNAISTTMIVAQSRA